MENTRSWAPFARVVVTLSLGSVCGAALAAPAWPLKINATGRTLEDQAGKPFLIAADTAWCMVNGLTDAEIDTYLAARKTQGFNAIQFMLMAKHSGCAVGGGSIDRYGKSPFVHGDADWSVPDEAYWTRVDKILNKVKAHDMLALVTPAYLGYSCFDGTEGWCGAMHAQSVQRMTEFGTFLGKRYRLQGNIVWIAGGDADAMHYPGMDVRVDALMSAITAADASRQLVTGHAGRHVSGFQGFGTHPWLTMNSAYDGESCPDASMAAQIATEYARTPAKPVLSIEQRYDQERATASCLADQFLWIALGGGVGQSYGNGRVWKFAADWNGPGTGVNSPLALVHTNAAKLVRSRRFWLFAPDYAHTVVTAGYGTGVATVVASRASTGETVMAYIPVSADGRHRGHDQALGGQGDCLLVRPRDRRRDAHRHVRDPGHAELHESRRRAGPRSRRHLARVRAPGIEGRDLRRRCRAVIIERGKMSAIVSESTSMKLRGGSPETTGRSLLRRTILLPLMVAVVAVLFWTALSKFEVFPSTAFPSPTDVVRGFVEKVRSGTLFDDIVASLFRVTMGFGLAVTLGIPVGLWLGLRVRVRLALLPPVNFFRSLSPLAWIPFAILWFGIGDVPSIFLIFMTAFFPLVLATSAAVSSIPTVYFRVAQNYDFRGVEFLTQVTLPAIVPQVITALRVTAGLSWVVVVAAEMIAGRDGLGFLIWDARNQLRPDLVVVGMIVIGIIGVIIDRILMRLTQLPSVRWGYDR